MTDFNTSDTTAVIDLDGYTVTTAVYRNLKTRAREIEISISTPTEDEYTEEWSLGGVHLSPAETVKLAHRLLKLAHADERIA
jgi:hypothetical protein